MLHGIYIPQEFVDKYENIYPVATANFENAKKAGVDFAIIQMNTSIEKHNENFADMVAATAKADIPVVIGLWKVNIPKYYEEFHEDDFWATGDLIAGDKHWLQYSNAIRNKEIHLVIVQVDHNTELTNGGDLPGVWFNIILKRMLSRIRTHSSTINHRITYDRVIPMMLEKVVEKYKDSVGNYMYGNENWCCADHSTYEYATNVTDFSTIGNAFPSDISPELAYAKNWAYWLWGQVGLTSAGLPVGFLSPDIRFSDGGKALFGVATFNGNRQQLIARYRPDYVFQDTPDDGGTPDIPDTPEEDTLRKAIQAEVANMRDVVSNIRELLPKA